MEDRGGGGGEQDQAKPCLSNFGPKARGLSEDKPTGLQRGRLPPKEEGGTHRGQSTTRGKESSAREVMGDLPLVGGREEQEGMVVQEDATEGSSKQ